MVAAASLGACEKGDSGDYCKNHYEYHSDHLDTVASLTIDLSELGDLDGSLMMPNSVFGDMAVSDIEALLTNAKQTFTLQSETPCTVSVTDIISTAGDFKVNYAANCGPDNKLKKIHITLFDHLSELEEVVTSVTTPATAKRFGISRQCNGPIFRLD
jgi:hypothetical protein